MDALLGSFLDLAAQTPGAPIATGWGGEWTRADLARRVLEGQLAWQREWAARGIAPGSVVALMVEPGPGFLAAFLACRAAQACVLLLDPGMAEEEQQRVAEALGACALWNSRAAEGTAVELRDSVRWLPGRQCFPDAACLKLTSGSSGEPAGVVVPTQSLVVDGRALIHSMGLCESDRIFAAVPMSHAYGLSVIASPAWLLGCTVVIPAQGHDLDVAERFGATIFPSVPSWYEAQLAAAGSPPMPSSLRLMMSAGAPLRPATAAAWRERHGLGIHVLYGSSECGAIAYDRQGDAAERGSVGTAVEGVRIELDGDEHVVVHSAAVAHGYWPQDEARAARITSDCFRTEDVASLEGGEVFLTGRRSHWINVKGKKVNPREIESVLGEHPAIRDVAVIGRRLPEGRGEAIRAVIACEEDSLRFRDVVTWCKPRLSRHKYPRSVVFVRELPRTARGKLDRNTLLAF